MAFTVEDGTGIPGANSFTTVQAFRDHWADRGTDVTALLDPDVEKLLVRATDYILQRWGCEFSGSRATETQTLPFPREGICLDGVEVADDAVPSDIQTATIIYALIAKDVAKLLPNPPIPFDRLDASGSIISGSGVVNRKREHVGPIEEETWFESQRDASTRTSGSSMLDSWVLPQYPEADLLIEKFLRGSSGSLIRV